MTVPTPTTLEPLDAIAAAIRPYCRDPGEAELAAKEACDALVANGYELVDRRDDMRKAGVLS